MEAINRRAFLKRGSVVVAAAGVAATLPSQFASAATKSVVHSAGLSSTATGLSPTAELGGESPGETVIAHVRSFESGEIAIFAGDQEVLLHDRGLAFELARAAKGGR